MTTVIDVKTVDEWKESVLKNSRAVIVYFWASWSRPHPQMDAVFTALAGDNKNVVFVKVEAEEVPEVSDKYSVTVAPTFLIFEGGKQTDSLTGAHAPELSQKVAALNAKAPSSAATAAASAPKTSTGTPVSAPTDGSLEDRMKALINAGAVMLFMKGEPSGPKCGFSRKIVALLQEAGIKFSSFDILTDNDIRQGLKEFSSWPTYPQLYVSGQLLGGLDIVKEMHEEGELLAAIPDSAKVSNDKPQSLEDRLKALTARAPVMLFMKGVPSAPQCGFSRTIVGLLNDQGIKYDSFNILEDNEVRQGLKEFSNWPTFPQLYIKGELVGGLDIVKEMIEGDELKDMIPA